MVLEEYSKKRKFGETPEPPPRRAPSSGGLSFCVQRHDATRLHYDFRLEMDGVLKSWAVPKGPSLDPADKRMAVHVEDHPLDYGGFEGNIPKGNYGAGSVMLWDRGTYEVMGDMPGAGQLARGDLKIRLHGEKLNGAFAVVHMKGRGKGNDWLLIKKKDEFAVPGYDIEAHARSVLSGRTQEEIARDLPATESKPAPRSRGRAEMPSQIEAMKAVSAGKPPTGSGWLYEIKWDGVRALCFLREGKLRLVSRNGNAMDRQYPELAVLPHHVRARDAILDGEIVALDDQGRPSFSLLQNRMTATDANSIAHMARNRPVVLYLFDLLFVDGEDLRGLPLTERKQRLERIVSPDGTIRISGHFESDPEALLAAARENGLEGIVAKRAASAYQGRRSPDWVKIKVFEQQEFVICGFTEGARDYFGALVLGYYSDGKLEYAGCAGTGFDRARMKVVYDLLEPLAASSSPFARAVNVGRQVTWVRPELVCEIRFAEWTREGRLRAPVFLGLRDDVDPREVARESSSVAAAPEPEPAAPATGPLLPSGKKQATIEVDGHSLKFTNLDKIWFPEDGITKRDVLEYYNAVADLINPHLEGRPLSLKRYPNGIHSEFFFQKNTPAGYPDWLRMEPVPSEHSGRPDPLHHRQGPRDAAISRQSRLHRPEPVDEPHRLA